MKAKRSIFFMVTASAMLGIPVFAQAQTIEPVDSFFVTVGAYRANNDVNLRWNPTSGKIPGASVDFKKDLGFDLDQTEPYFKIGGSFGRHHQHQITAFRLKHDGDSSMTLTDDYQIGDDLYVASADFEGDVDIDIIGLSYTWFLFKRRSTAFGIGLGAIRYDISASFAAAAVADAQVKAVDGHISEKAWVPQIHAEYIKSLSRHWRFAVQASYVKKSGGNISGDAVDLNARIGYFPWKHFGISLGYIYNDLDLDFDKSRFDGKVDIKTHGPKLALTYRF